MKECEITVTNKIIHIKTRFRLNVDMFEINKTLATYIPLSIADFLGSITGVYKINIEHPYSIYLYIADLFSTDEIAEKVKKLLNYYIEEYKDNKKEMNMLCALNIVKDLLGEDRIYY